jgi:hypothetical protein
MASGARPTGAWALLRNAMALQVARRAARLNQSRGSASIFPEPALLLYPLNCSSVFFFGVV